MSSTPANHTALVEKTAKLKIAIKQASKADDAATSQLCDARIDSRSASIAAVDSRKTHQTNGFFLLSDEQEFCRVVRRIAP